MLSKYERDNLAAVQEQIEIISAKAKELGLDFFNTLFELVPSDIIYTLGADGMPIRYPHWSLGKEFYRMKTMYDHGLGKIYEMVINSDPCYAFLMDNNTLTQNMLIIAHVLAHNDFFKNNYRFKSTRRDMVESMAAAAKRVEEYERKYGKDRVEELLDAARALSPHVDAWGLSEKPKKKDEEEVLPRRDPYQDLWEDYRDTPVILKMSETKKIPPTPQFDLLKFFIDHGRNMEPWETDILTIVRDEQLYFTPQIETKIMNEGWATYWHCQIMRSLDLDLDQAIDFARMHADVVTPSKTRLNPYYLGFKMFERIKERWDNPSEDDLRRGVQPGSGLQKIFDIRANETDAGFIRNYLDEKLVEDLDLYVFEKQEQPPEQKTPHRGIPNVSDKYDFWVITEKKWKNVRDQIVSNISNHGVPLISVEDGYYEGGTLLLKHHYDGIPLDKEYTANTMVYLSNLWNGGKVLLDTVYKDTEIRLIFEPSVKYEVRAEAL